MSEPLTGGSNGHEDPFFVFRSDLLRKLELLDEQLAELERVVHEQDTIKLRNIKKSLKKGIKDASLTFNDLETCVQLGGGNLSADEVYERQCFAKSCQDRLNQAKKAAMAVSSHSNKPNMSPKSNGGYDMLANGDLEHGGGGGGHAMSSSAAAAAAAVPGGAKASLLMQHQDETLDELDAAVTRVGTMAEHINEEIGAQGVMLDEMEQDLDEAEQQLGAVMGKLSDFLGTKDRFTICTIAALFLVAVVLLLLVVYT